MSKKSLIIVSILFLLLFIVVGIIIYPQFNPSQEHINSPDVPSQEKAQQEARSQTEPVENSAVPAIPVSVEDYKKEMTLLIAETENLVEEIADKAGSGQSIVGIKAELNKIRENLTALRVPAEFRDLHLSIYKLFGDIEQAMESPDQLQLNSLKKELQEANDSLKND